MNDELDAILESIGERPSEKDRDQESIFGQIAIRLGYTTSERLLECMDLQKKLESMGLWEKLGAVMIRRGYLTKAQVDEVLNHQGAGRKFGDFDLLAKLGEGGMGSVYKARYNKSGEMVALKILPKKLADNPKLLQRFMNEVKMAMMLSHPNLVAGVDMGEFAGYNYLAMKYIEGTSIQHLLDEARKDRS